MTLFPCRIGKYGKYEKYEKYDNSSFDRTWPLCYILLEIHLYTLIDSNPMNPFISATTDIWSWILLKVGIWLGLVAMITVVSWAILDFIVIKAGYANCRLKAYLRNDLDKTSTDMTADLLEKKLRKEVTKTINTGVNNAIDMYKTKVLRVGSATQEMGYDGSGLLMKNHNVKQSELQPSVSTSVPSSSVPTSTSVSQSAVDPLENANMLPRSNIGAQGLGIETAMNKELYNRINPKTTSSTSTSLTTNMPGYPIMTTSTTGNNNNNNIESQTFAPNSVLPGITQIPGGTPVVNSNEDMSDRMAIARLASEMSGMSIRMNPWIKATMSGGNLDCRRSVKAPSELPFTNLNMSHVSEVCTWVCSKRFSGHLGRYAGTFDTSDNTCNCYIQDCASTTNGSNTGRARKTVETPTNGVLITSKESAAAMCPSVCLMRYPGLNAEALPSWDGKSKEGQTLTSQDQTCFCVVDDETQ